MKLVGWKIVVEVPIQVPQGWNEEDLMPLRRKLRAASPEIARRCEQEVFNDALYRETQGLGVRFAKPHVDVKAVAE